MSDVKLLQVSDMVIARGRRAKAERRRRDLAARDAAYAANAPKVTVEEHVKPGGRVVVIETRGNRCIGGWGV